MLKFLGDKDGTQNQVMQILEGKYSGLLLRISGSSAASVSRPTGLIRVNLKNQGNIVTVNFDTLIDITNFFFGAVEDTAGTSFAFSAIVPFALPYMANALDLEPNEAELYLPAVSADSATWEVYGILTEEPEKFILKTYTRTYSMTGNLKEPIELDNILGLWLETESGATAPTRLAVLRDDEMIAEADWDVFESWTNLSGRLESPLTDKVFVDLNPEREITTALADSYTIQATGGSGNLRVITFSADIEPERTKVSHIKTITKIQRKIERKVRRKPQIINALTMIKRGPEGEI